MKKFASILLVLCMILGMTASASAVSASDIKIGMICIGDENEGYSANHINSLLRALERLGVDKSQVVWKYNIDESQAAYDAAVELAEEGCDIIFATSFGHESYFFQAASEYPEIQFCHATGVSASSSELSNVHNYFPAIYEARYVSGIVAGMKLNQMIADGTITAEQAKIGYVGAFPYAEVISGYTAFFLGARSVCPSATMEVTFTYSWYDEAMEKEGAQMLIEQKNCVLISQHADSMGAPTACEVAGVPNVSYNGSTVAACPDTFIVSSRINWAPYFEFIINCMLNGEEIPADWTGTIATGSVELSAINEQAAAAGTIEKIEEVKAGLADGTVKVFDTAAFTVNGEALTTYLADVDDMGDFVGETEVVIDGEFAESEFRSAPYFDLSIDGIILPEGI